MSHTHTNKENIRQEVLRVVGEVCTQVPWKFRTRRCHLKLGEGNRFLKVGERSLEWGLEGWGIFARKKGVYRVYRGKVTHCDLLCLPFPVHPGFD